MQLRIALDTNIYRQLGATFYEHPDYQSLDDFCYSSVSSIVIPLTVLREYLDFYEYDILHKNISEIVKAHERLQKLDKFKTLAKPSLAKRAKAQLKLIRKKLTEFHNVIDGSVLFDEEQLLDFLIANKRENRKDNTRDFLIWLSILFTAFQHDEEQIILISDDKIFTENTYFKEIANHHQIKNVKVFDSISSFLSVYGFRSPALTKELILAAIPVKPIEQALLEHKDEIPSHISGFYADIDRDFKLELLNLNGLSILSFYAHKDVENEEVAIIAHVLADVNIIYEPEQQLEKLNAYLASPKRKPGFLDTFDTQGRPLYQEEMMFMYRLTYDEKLQEITSCTYIDFFPDEYRTKYKVMAKLAIEGPGAIRP